MYVATRLRISDKQILTKSQCAPREAYTYIIFFLFKSNCMFSYFFLIFFTLSFRKHDNNNDKIHHETITENYTYVADLIVLPFRLYHMLGMCNLS